MFLVFELLFLFICLVGKKSNKCFYILLGLQFFSAISHYLVGFTIDYSSLKTFINLCYIFLSTFLIIYPWRRITNVQVVVDNVGFFFFYKKILFPLLKVNLLLFVIIWALVWYFIPDVSALKQDMAFKDLYDSIPYFGFVYRYASVVKYLGLLAIPFLGYYLQQGDRKGILESLICSLSVLVIGLATYNRAVMSLYILLLVCSYFLFQDRIDNSLNKKIIKWMKLFLAGSAAFFIGISIVRFSSSNMDYYADNIPNNSLIKTPVSYSLLSYFSQGTVNGINFLELYDGTSKIKGAMITYDLNQMLAYFGLINWKEDDVEKVLDKTYNISGLSSENKSDNFHGYAADMVANFGYLLSLFFSFVYFIYIVGSIRKGHRLNFTRSTILILLLIIPVNSIFYMSYGMLVFPVIFFVIIRVIYNLFFSSSYRRKVYARK